MPLSAYSLVTLPELKDHLAVAGDGQDFALENIANRVSDEIETHLDRQIVTRGSLTEYHNLPRDPETSEIRTLEWPIISITSVHEDTGIPRTYGAAYLLVDGTGYQAVKPKGIIRRLEYLGWPKAWACGTRVVKVVYAAGYAANAVPERIKAVALRYAALIWDERKRGTPGVSSQSDALGNFTRFAAAQLTPEMRNALAAEMRPRFIETGERDS